MNIPLEYMGDLKGSSSEIEIENTSQEVELICNTKTSDKQIKYHNIALIACIVIILGYTLYNVFGNKEIYEISSDEDVNSKRKATRGMIASLLTGLSFGIVNALIDAKGEVDPSTSTALIGMILSGTIGFIMDNAIGTDLGLQTFKEQGTSKGISQAFGVLATSRYARFLITVLMDTFVSLILFKGAYEWLISKPYFSCKNLPIFGNGSSIANGIMSTVIGLITFNAYANQTRFYWAYPDSGVSTIDGSVILLSTTILALIFYQSDTIIDSDNPGLNGKGTKLILCFVTLAMLTLLSMNGMIEPSNVDNDIVLGEYNEEEANKIIKNSWYGKFVYVALCAVCFFGVFSTTTHKTNAWKYGVPAGLTGLMAIACLTDL